LYLHLLHFRVSCWEESVETDGRNTSLNGQTQRAEPCSSPNNLEAAVFKAFELIMCTI